MSTDPSYTKTNARLDIQNSALVIDYNNSLKLGGRVGVFIRDDLAPYFTLGVERLNKRLGDINKHPWGVTTGVGLEYYVTDTISLRPQIDYTYFNRLYPNIGTDIAGHKLDMLVSMSYYPFADKSSGVTVGNSESTKSKTKWDGLYAGAFFDYSALEINGSETQNTPSTFEGVAIGGAGYGVNLGYSHTFGINHQYYSALEADFALKGAGFNVNKDFFGVRNRAGLSFVGGYITSADVLVFGKVGAKSISIDTGSLYTGSKKGAVIGLGLELPVMNNINFRAEYEYSTFKNIKTNTSNYNVDLNNNVLRAGMAYRF